MVSDQVMQDIGESESVVLFGIEAHVCVLQTALDLLAKGKEVHIVVDGTSSMRQFDRVTAFTVCCCDL
jgi:nicotinamidase-related amidase